MKGWTHEFVSEDDAETKRGICHCTGIGCADVGDDPVGVAA